MDGFIEEKGTIIHLTVTGRCYARCEGCINRAITFASGGTENPILQELESDPERDASTVLSLVRKCPDRRATVVFYGGEPFLAADKMEEVRQRITASEVGARVRFMVDTNGDILSQALKNYPDLMKSMWLYSVSIDGDEAQHGRFRPGTDLARIRQNLRELRRVYDGAVLMWSTLREDQSLLICFEEFLKLYQEGLVNHFFWHWADANQPYGDLTDYLAQYESDLREIMKAYTERCQKGEVLPIAHLNELILYFITGKERGHTACGVELAENYDIIGGRVCACSDLPAGYGEVALDDSPDAIKRRLRSLVKYKKGLGCYECHVHPYCGGRCPVQAVAGSPERTQQICQLMRLHVDVVREYLDRIVDGIGEHGVTLQKIYDRSAFIARYTDVVP